MINSRFYDEDFRSDSNRLYLRSSSKSQGTLELGFRAVKAFQICSEEEMPPEIILTVDKSDFGELTSYWEHRNSSIKPLLEMTFGMIFSSYAHHSILNTEARLGIEHGEGWLRISKSSGRGYVKEIGESVLDAIETIAVVPDDKAMQIYVDGDTILITHTKRCA